MGIISGVLKAGVVAAAAYGVYSLFKDEIKETSTYQQLNEKYDVDNKVESATEKVKGTVMDTAKTVSSAAKTAKEKAVETWNKMAPDKEADAEEAAKDAADEVKEAVEDTAEEVKEAVEESAEAAADAANYQDVADAVNNIVVE